jgi:hypothetical protein
MKKMPKHAPNPTGMDNLWVILDYHRLNAKSSLDQYSIRRVEEFTHSKFFITLDLTTGF